MKHLVRIYSMRSRYPRHRRSRASVSSTTRRRAAILRRRRFDSGTTVPLAETAPTTSALEVSIYPLADTITPVPIPRISFFHSIVQMVQTVRLRKFDKIASIRLAQLSTIFDCATRGLPADFLEPPGTQLNDLYLIVHSVQG